MDDSNTKRNNRIALLGALIVIVANVIVTAIWFLTSSPEAIAAPVLMF